MGKEKARMKTIPRISQQQLESYLWGAATLLRGTIDAGDYKQFIFPLLFFKRLCDVFDEETQNALKESGGDSEFAAYPENHRFQIPEQSHWNQVRKASKNVGQALQSSMRAIETANPEKLYGIFGDAQWTNKDRLSDSMLRDLIEHFSSLELTVANLPEDELGQGYEYLIKKFADDSGHTAAEFYTNRTVVHLMTELLQPQPGESIYDPTCGSGGMLLSAIAHLKKQGKEWRNVRLFGQERNLMTSSIARMNCFLHGVEDFRIERGDTIAEPKLVESDKLMKFDVVLANPPYSIKQWDRDAFASDPWGRNLYGTPPQGRADYVFWQHILCSMAAKSGRCAILFPHGVLFRQEEQEMRRKLIDADLIECVIGLGPNLFYNSPMEACVVICRTSKPKNRKGKILLINAIGEVTRERAQSFLTDEHIERLVESYVQFKDESGFTNTATLEQIRAKDYSLSIPLYVAAAGKGGTQEKKSDSDLSGLLDSWLKSITNVRTTLSDILPEGNLSSARKRYAAETTWANLALFDRAEWKRVRFGDVVENINETCDPVSAGLERFIGLDHLEPGSFQITRWGNVEDGTTFTRRCRPGQVLFGKRRAYQRKVAVADFDAVVSGDIYLLAPLGKRVLPELLPFLCISEPFFDHAVGTSAGSLSPRTNWSSLAEFEFDLPPLDQQRRIAEILWALDLAIQKLHGVAGDLQVLRRAIFGPDLARFPTRPLIEVADFLDGKRVPLSEKERAKRRGPYPYYGASGIIDSVDDFLFDEALVLLSEDGFNLVNRTSRIAFKVEGKTWVNNHAHVLRPRTEVNIDFLSEYLESISVEPYITGTYQRKLNKSECERIPIPIPSAAYQADIARMIARIENVMASLQVQVAVSKKLVSLLVNLPAQTQSISNGHQ
ncbi:MAG: N-6 DNA methylase [Leptospirales bacterium]|nr:N-6 DNA methylase [Leptospirales bacterium]